MANHKRKKAKNGRACCLMCKPNKMNGWSPDTNPNSLGHKGFGKIKKEIAAAEELKTLE